MSASSKPITPQAERLRRLGRRYTRSRWRTLTRMPRVTPNSLLVALLATFALCLVNFLPFELASPAHFADLPGDTMRYSLLIPIALSLGALLGPVLAGIATGLCVLVGLFVAPVFGAGGGLAYLAAPSFGYTVGLIPAAFLLGHAFRRRIRRDFPFQKPFSLLLCAILGVGLAHATGLGVYTVHALVQGVDWAQWHHWVTVFTLYPILYDFALTYAFLLAVPLLRFIFWFALY